jgi:hypothetical protein
MNTTRSMSGWLVRSASPPSISIHQIGIVSSSTLGHIFFMTPLWTAAPNHADCAFAQHRSAKSFLRKQKVAMANLPSTLNQAHAPTSSNSQSQMRPHVLKLPPALTIQ